MEKLNRHSLFPKLQLFCLYGIAVTITFSILNLNSLFIIGLILSWLFSIGSLSQVRELRTDRLFIAYILYFLLHIAGLFTSDSFAGGWKHLESKLGYLVLPLALCSGTILTRQVRNKVLMVFTITLTAATLLCLIVAFYKYSTQHDVSVFFYHDLLTPISHHAVYFSAFILIAIAFLATEYQDITWLRHRSWLMLFWIGYFMGITVLLSSKLMLSITIMLLLFLLLKSFHNSFPKRQILIVLIILGGLSATILLTDNIVKRRFNNLFEGNIDVLKSDKFNPGNSFTGLEFRLLLWRFTYEIMAENNAWVLGVGTAGSQEYLVRKYHSMNMYAGDERKGDHGYMAYNCHNQFLQTSLQSGLLGLSVLLFWCFVFCYATIKSRDKIQSVLAITILCFFFTESVLERQYGMILTCFFPLILLYSKSRADQS
ncbi:O-antigen ligase family protein [Flavitalea antarctica]